MLSEFILKQNFGSTVQASVLKYGTVIECNHF